MLAIVAAPAPTTAYIAFLETACIAHLSPDDEP
jgi:hypothetical protein